MCVEFLRLKVLPPFGHCETGRKRSERWDEGLQAMQGMLHTFTKTVESGVKNDEPSVRQLGQDAVSGLNAISRHGNDQGGLY